ncbi:MAG TPA: hypothetical protein VIU64_16010 [Polyangia bacterium]
MGSADRGITLDAAAPRRAAWDPWDQREATPGFALDASFGAAFGTGTGAGN